jgi:hypothetical protein
MFLRLLMTNHFLYGFHSRVSRLGFVGLFDRMRNRLRIRNRVVGRLLRLLLLLGLGVSFVSRLPIGNQVMDDWGGNENGRSWKEGRMRNGTRT